MPPSAPQSPSKIRTAPTRSVRHYAKPSRRASSAANPHCSDAKRSPIREATPQRQLCCQSALLRREAFANPRSHAAEAALLPILILLLLLFLLPSPLRAEATAAPPTPTAIVPFDPDKPLSQQNPTQVYLDYPTFERLWKAAKITRRDRGETEDQNETPPEIARAESDIAKADTVLTTALYKAEARDEALSITAQLQLFARGKGVREFPLSFGTAAIDKITLGDTPAAYRDGKIILPGAGHHTVTVHFDLPLKRGWRTADWTIPPAAAALLSLTLAESDGDPTINGGIPLVQSSGPQPEAEGEAPKKNQQSFTASLGSASTVKLELTSRTRAHALEEPSLADIAARLFVTPALDRLEADFDFKFIGGEQDTFSFSFEENVTPVGVTVPDLKSWTLRDGEGGTKVLEFTLASPARDRLQVGFTGERAASKIPGPATFPKLSAGAARITRKLALLTVPEVKIVPRPPAAFRQVPLDTDTAGTGFRFIAAFESATSAAALPFELTAGALDRTAESEIVFQVGRGKIETFAGFQLRSPDSDLHTAVFDLPPDSAVESVLGSRIADWWRDADTLYLRFSGETPAITTALIYLSRQIKAPEDGDAPSDSLTLIPPFPRNFTEVTGTGILAAHAASDTLLRFDKPITTVKEIAPDEAARVFDFAIVPPFERKRGFSFEKGEFEATVTLSRLEPRFDAIWTMRADVHETWTAVSAFVDLEVKRSALNSTTFTLPADTPEARISGDQIREVTSEVKGELREYTVSFQNDITDQVRFEIETETTHAGESELPVLTFPQANRTESFVIVDNYSKDRMAVTHENAAVATANQLPYEPDYVISASFYRVRAGWSITAKLEELETTAGNRALALYAEHTSAIRKNGEVWTRAKYRLQNRSLQFLPVRIPAGSEVVGARVAGSTIRIDKAVGGASDQILIPLIQTAPGQIAYDVELILRRPGNGESVVSKLTQKLEDPELIGVPVERTTWRVFLPEGFELKGADGNMTEVTTADVDYVRAESQLKELKKKVSTARSDEVAASDRNANYLSANKDIADLDDYIRFNKPQAGNAEFDELTRQLTAQRRILEDETQRQQTMPQTDSPAQLALPNGWNINPSAIGGRQKQIDENRAKYYEGIEGKLGLNDNVILGNRKLLTKPEEQSSPNLPGDPFGAPETEKPEEQPVQKGRATQLDRLEKNEEAAGEKGKSDELFRNQSLDLGKAGAAVTKDGREPPQIPQQIGTPQPPAKKPQHYGAEQQAQTLDQGFTNNARFLNNRAIEQSKGQDRSSPQQAPKPGEPATPDNQSEPPMPSVNAPGRPQSSSSGGQRQNEGPGFGGGFSSRDSVENGARFTPQFKPDGRVSLAIDFPTEGEPIVFSKLKAHANLTVTAADPGESSGRLSALLTLAISLAVLFLLDRLVQKRRAATA